MFFNNNNRRTKWEKEETKRTRWHSLPEKAAHWERVGTSPPLSTCPLLHVVFLSSACSNFLLSCSLPPTPRALISTPSPSFLPLFKAVITHPGITISGDFIPMQLPPNQCPQVWNSITRHKTGGSTHLHFGGAQQKHQILSEIRHPGLKGHRKKKKQGCLSNLCKEERSLEWKHIKICGLMIKNHYVAVAVCGSSFHWHWGLWESGGHDAISLIEREDAWCLHFKPVQCFVYESWESGNELASPNSPLSTTQSL